MPKKQWTEEERKAFGAKMKASKAAKAAQTVAEPVAPPQPVEAASENADIGDLLRRMHELENLLKLRAPQQQLETPQMDRGSLVGEYEKYNTSPEYYPDPRERLAKEPRLKRFAFSDNFELDFSVGLSSYETKSGINTKEPKFVLKLVRIVYDDETGERKIVYNADTRRNEEQRYVTCQMIFHEDPGTALVVARENGISVDVFSEKDFLDEMRYLRMRDWLLDCFFPPAPIKAQDRKEQVIGNQLVEVYTVSSETPESMAPFFGDKSKL